MLISKIPIDLAPGDQWSNLLGINIAGIISAFVVISLILASISFFFSLLFGGIKWILSGGKKERTDIAKAQIVNSLIGILIVFSAFALINLLSEFFGINLLTFDIPSAI
jgi:hypothetical protein